MLKSDTVTRLSAAMLAIAAALPTGLQANEIALTLKDQGITISGDFAGFRDKAYLVMTSSGLIHVPAEIVTCEGDDCLVIVTAASIEE